MDPTVAVTEAMEEPLLEECERTSEVLASDKSDALSRLPRNLWRIRSCPPRDTPKPNAKYMTRAAKSVPLPPQFAQEGEGISTLLKALIGLVSYLLVGILSFSLLQGQLQGVSTSMLVDAMYFAIVTMTTVGYGDLVPQSVGAKLFTCAYVFVGFGLVGVLVSGAANYLVEKQEKILAHKVHLKHKQKCNSEEVVDDDEVVAAKWKVAISGAAVVLLFITGVLVLMFCEGQSFINAFYCVCVTVTTLGYGDQSFHTKAGRIFAIFWILSSTVCVAQFFLYVAESRTEERQYQLAAWALSRPTTRADLEAADVDGDGTVSAAEFVIYKLKELGKIDEEDVLDVLKEFNALDHDQSGHLNCADVGMMHLAKRPASAA